MYSVSGKLKSIFLVFMGPSCQDFYTLPAGTSFLILVDASGAATEPLLWEVMVHL